jgi:hypothetical protein
VQNAIVIITAFARKVCLPRKINGSGSREAGHDKEGDQTHLSLKRKIDFETLESHPQET